MGQHAQRLNYSCKPGFRPSCGDLVPPLVPHFGTALTTVKFAATGSSPASKRSGDSRSGPRRRRRSLDGKASWGRQPKVGLPRYEQQAIATSRAACDSQPRRDAKRCSCTQSRAAHSQPRSNSTKACASAPLLSVLPIETLEASLRAWVLSPKDRRPRRRLRCVGGLENRPKSHPRDRACKQAVASPDGGPLAPDPLTTHTACRRTCRGAAKDTVAAVGCRYSVVTIDGIASSIARGPYARRLRRTLHQPHHLPEPER